MLPLSHFSHVRLFGTPQTSPPGSSVHGILQARILEWAAIPCSRGSLRPRDWAHVSCISCTGRWILYHWATWEVRCVNFILIKIKYDKNVAIWYMQLKGIREFLVPPLQLFSKCTFFFQNRGFFFLMYILKMYIHFFKVHSKSFCLDSPRVDIEGGTSFWGSWRLGWQEH